jgi:hypothetical protein
MQVQVEQEKIIAIYASERLAYKLAAESLAAQNEELKAELAKLKEAKDE